MATFCMPRMAYSRYLATLRLYLVSDYSQLPQPLYQLIDLRGMTLRFTVDVSKVPCSTNAALYFVRMGESAKYCDIQTHPACAEIDLFEGNRMAIQSTVHTKTGLGGDGSCNQWGCVCSPPAANASPLIHMCAADHAADAIVAPCV